jgi:hypothetical protein
MAGAAALLLLLAAAAASPVDCPALAALPPGVSSPEDKRITCQIPAPLRLQVQQAEARGLRLRRHDLAAWLASKALREMQAFERSGGEPAAWLGSEVEGGIEVRFFEPARDGARAFASAILDDRNDALREVRVLAPTQSASAREQRLLLARATALAVPRLQCGAGLNTIVLEEPGLEAIRVYLFSAWDDRAAPMGGHSRVLVSRDGTTVLESFRQSPGCLDFPSTPDPKQMLLVPDVHAGPPTELQVFLQRQYDVPVVVHHHGDDSFWKVQDGLLYLLEPGDPLRGAVIRSERRDADKESK